MSAMSEPRRWLGVEVRHLAALHAVAETGSFVAAGARLGYSQSAISLQIAALERVAGTRLLERPGGRRPVSLTPAGEQVMRHARQIVDRIRAAEADLSALASGRAGVVSLGTFPTASRHLLPVALQILRESHPAIEVSLDDVGHPDQPARLAAGQTDLVLGLLPFDGPFVIRELLSDPYVFITATDTGAFQRLPTVAELAELPLISWQHPPFAIEALLRSHGHEPLVTLRTDDSNTVQRLVRRGLGVAVLPRLAIDLPDSEITTVDAAPLLPARRVVLARNRDRQLPPAADALSQAIIAAAERYRRASGSAPMSRDPVEIDNAVDSHLRTLED
jgi:DNA-binding transcriptional LysR family regulator